MENMEQKRKALHLDRQKALAALERLDERQADMTVKRNQAAAEMATSLGEWAKGTQPEGELQAAYAAFGRLVTMTDPELFRLAKSSLEAEATRLNEEIQDVIRQITRQKKAAKFRELFNTALANGRLLTRDERIALEENVPGVARSALDRLYMALTDYAYKFSKHPSPPPFQEYSKIESYQES